MRKINIKNFKCFTTSTEINFANITINVGMNSVGKSTLIQSILLMRQTYDEIVKYRGTTKDTFEIPLNGPFDLQIGSYNQIASNGADSIVLSLNDFSMEYTQGQDEFSLKYTQENPLEILPSNTLFAPNFYYINAERLGPRNYQSIGESAKALCGYHGENTFAVLEKFANSKIEDSRKRKGDDFSVNIFSKQLEYWMDYIVPGIQFNTNKDTDTRTTKLKIRQTSYDTDFNSPHNFGFGISYLLPIIVTGLLAETGSVMVVENPEAHLHPSGQSKIGAFLAQMAHAGIKVIIETHSEHVVNGIRLFALKNEMSKDEICINYFTAGEKSPHVERIELSEKMDILKWPEGFFDQEEKDLCELRHLRRGK